MSIKYKMVQRGDNLNPEEKKKVGYYPQMVRNATIGLDEISNRIAKGKRMQAYETTATLQLLLACIEDELLAGNNVCLDGFGTFSLSVKCKRPITSPNEVRAESMEVKRVTFTPSSPLRKRMKEAVFTKAK